jgi:hypothetical protein
MGCGASTPKTDASSASKRDKHDKRPIISEEDAMKQRNERLTAAQQEWDSADEKCLMQLSSRRLLSPGNSTTSPSTTSLNPKSSVRAMYPQLLESSPTSVIGGSPSIFDLLDSEEDEADALALPDAVALPVRLPTKVSRMSSYQKDTCRRDSFQSDEHTACWRPMDATLPGEVAAHPAHADNEPASAYESFLHTNSESTLKWPRKTQSAHASVFVSLRRKLISPQSAALLVH